MYVCMYVCMYVLECITVLECSLFLFLQEACDYSKWANPEVHVRSPELFHELIDADRNG